MQLRTFAYVLFSVALQKAAKTLTKIMSSPPLKPTMSRFQKAKDKFKPYCDSSVAKAIRSERFQCIKAIVEKYVGLWLSWTTS
jgi:hypothetical protein